MKESSDIIIQNIDAIQMAVRKYIDGADYEDVVQDSIIRCLTKLHLFEPGTSIRSFMFVVASRVAIDHLRKNKRHKLEHFQSESQWPKYLSGGFKEVYKQLKPIHQLMISLKYIEGLSIKEIMDLTGKTESAVKMATRRARQKFQQLYLKHDRDSDYTPSKQVLRRKDLLR